jgi:hypothetical protein
MAAVPREGACAVGSLLSGALSWLAVVTIGLAPMLVYWLARVIGRALWRRARGPTAGGPRAEPEKGIEDSGAIQLRRGDEAADGPQSSH